MTSPWETALPPLYARWLGEALAEPLPAEPRATCSSCALCPDAEGRPPVAALVFRPDVKCCTYTPRLPNFLAGMGLSDPDAAPSIRARLAARSGATPLHLGPPPAQQVLFGATVNAIGRSVRLRCPHFDDGRCSIWRYRDATCATWFCRHTRGARGQRLWRAVKQLLEVAQDQLALWCALQEGLPAEVLAGPLVPATDVPAPQRIDGVEADGGVDPHRYAAAWGPWVGREEELYRRTAARVGTLSWVEVREVCGPEVEALEGLVVERRAALDAPLPARIRVGSFQLLGVAETQLTAITYSSTDPVVIPRALVDHLHLVDGRPTAVVLADLAERGAVLTDEQVAELVDWGVFLGA